MTQIQLPPLARQALDRDYLLRTKPDLISSLLESGSAIALVMHAGKVLTNKEGGLSLRLTPLVDAPKSDVVVYLGKTNSEAQGIPTGTEICLVVADKNQAAAIEPDVNN